MDILEFLAQTANILETEKFVSVKDAKEQNANSTGDKAAWDVIQHNVTFTDENLSFAREALDWIRSYTGDNKYLVSLQKSASFDDIGVGMAGRVAWVIPAYVRNMEEALPSIVAQNSQFCGTVAREHAFVGTVAALRTYKRFNREKQVITLLDDKGNVFVYFPSNKILPVQTGDRVRCFGTVKAHNVYNGVNQTVLTRAKLLPA